jgi:tetratricopeptide (TPR) repeat protein
MAKGKKIKRKKLKEPDEFITFTEKAFRFFIQQAKKIAAGGVVLLVIAISFFLYQRWESHQEGEASQKLGLAIEIYQEAGSANKERSPSVLKDALQKFNEIISRFPRTSSGKLSLLYKGNIHLQLAEFDEAAKTYQAFLKKGPEERPFRAFALEGLGYAYEGKKDYEKAVQAYQRIIDMGDGVESAGAYSGMGRCYERMGKKKEALENYKSFLKVSQKSQMTYAILRKISSLEKE